MIGYPNRKVMPTPAVKAQDNHMGRGMSLENDLNDSNAYYCSCDRALIHKKPTPIQVVKVDYPVPPKLRKPIIKHQVQQITTVSIVEELSILKQRKQGRRPRSPSKAFIHIRLSI